MEEEWRDIEGYEGLYQVSNLGNVKSLNYRKMGFPKLLAKKTSRDGRLWVCLYKDGNNKPMLIHRLVGMAFIENPNNLPQINHKDENPKNNHVDNLEWCDALYNMRYSFALHPDRKIRKVKNMPYPTGKRWHEIHKNHPGGWKNTSPLYNKAIVQMTDDMEVIKEWSSIRNVCKETGWRHSSIKECCEGKRKTAYGFKWQYAV